MQIEYVKGDFIDGPEAVILHGCNAQGVMGRGAALAVKQRLPFAFEAYRAAYDEAVRLNEFLSTPTIKPPEIRLGSVIWAISTESRPRVVGNMITQRFWQSHLAPFENGRNVDYFAVQMVFREVARFVQSDLDIAGITPITRVGMVKIGAGLGGGDWSIISKIIEDESGDLYQPVVYEL